MISTSASTGSYYIGDKPQGTVEIQLDTDEDLTPFTSVAVRIEKPDGTLTATATGTISYENLVSFDWPTGFTFTDAGQYQLKLTLVGTATNVRLSAVPVIIQDEDGWQTLDSARAQWTDAVQMEDGELFELLEVAKGQCIAFAPALAEDAAVPLNYRKAQLLQARNLWNASKVDTGANFDEDGNAIPVFPMDWSVKNMLRPKRGIPVLG